MTGAIKKTMGLAEWGMLATLGVIWGGSFYFFVIAIGGLPTFTIVFLRVSIATLALGIAVGLSGLRPPSNRAAWRDFSDHGAPQQCRSLLAHRMGTARTGRRPCRHHQCYDAVLHRPRRQCLHG